MIPQCISRVDSPPHFPPQLLDTFALDSLRPLLDFPAAYDPAPLAALARAFLALRTPAPRARTLPTPTSAAKYIIRGGPAAWGGSYTTLRNSGPPAWSTESCDGCSASVQPGGIAGYSTSGHPGGTTVAACPYPTDAGTAFNAPNACRELFQTSGAAVDEGAAGASAVRRTTRKPAPAAAAADEPAQAEDDVGIVWSGPGGPAAGLGAEAVLLRPHWPGPDPAFLAGLAGTGVPVGEAEEPAPATELPEGHARSDSECWRGGAGGGRKERGGPDGPRLASGRR
jgi:hypothetical protein